MWRHSSYRDIRVYLTGPICSLCKPSEEVKGPFWRCDGQSRSAMSSIIIPPPSADSTSDVRRLGIPPVCKLQFVELLGTSPSCKMYFFFPVVSPVCDFCFMFSNCSTLPYDQEMCLGIRTMTQAESDWLVIILYS